MTLAKPLTPDPSPRSTEARGEKVSALLHVIV